MLRIIVSSTLVLLALGLSAGQSPQTVRDILKRGSSHLEAGELDAALADANRAIELEPKNAESYVLRALVRERIKPETDISDDCDKIIELAPNRSGIEVFYQTRAVFRFRKQDLDGSVNDMNQAIAIKPNDGQAYEMRSFYYLWKGNLEQSQADYYKSIALVPGLPSPFTRRGYIRYHLQGDLVGALADFNKAIEWNSEYAEGYADRGIVRGLQGNIDEAIVDFRKAKTLKPDAILDRAPEFAFCAPFRELSSFIKSYPNEARGYEVRGILNLLQDREREANADFESSLGLQPSLKSEIDRIRTQLLRKLSEPPVPSKP
jgi:tetratricopeptide (TPR) repeat protein